MSEPPKVILLDSNAYFRLARTVHPLLAGTFSTNPAYSLYVLADLDDEYLTSSKLKNKFEWVNDPEYKKDRKVKRYQSKGKKKLPVENAFSFLAAYAKSNAINVAPEDLRALATGFALEFPVVTDDTGMKAIADAHSIECWSIIKLLKLMLTTNRITSDKIAELLQYLNHENDLPMGYNKLRVMFQEYFDSTCPI